MNKLFFLNLNLSSNSIILNPMISFKELSLGVFLIFNFLFSVAQKPNWQNLDLKEDSVFGISTEKAYGELLINRKSIKVIVAVIDSGIDTTQEDLKAVLWKDSTDGSHGRSWMDLEVGMEDVARLAVKKKDFYDSLSFSIVPEAFRGGYKTHRIISKDLSSHRKTLEEYIAELENSGRVLEKFERRIGKADLTMEDLKQVHPDNKEEEEILKIVLKSLPGYMNYETFKWQELSSLIAQGRYHLQHGLNINIPVDVVEKNAYLGNENVSFDPLGLVKEPNFTSYHGTHVAGIIGANRNNKLGIKGVADNVDIMMLKVLSGIREMRDVNLAAAIRFACDHGAKIINMSLGKYYTADKKIVDEAVQYAMSKDILIVKASGNLGSDLDKDSTGFYPNSTYMNGQHAAAWITVGASGFKDDSTLIPSFSNYGKRSVDVFAPGVEIRSTIPHSSYLSWSGTSMATPVVTGLAALIRSYYPKLSALQVKNIIMQSVIKPSRRIVLKDETGNQRSVWLSEICVSGGIVNAYRAIELAEKLQKVDY